MRLDRLVAERGCARPVDHAAKRAGNLPRAGGKNVPAEHAVVGSWLEVQTGQHAIGVVNEIGCPEEIVRAGLIRRGHERKDRRGNRIDPLLRNRVVHEGLAGDRILDGRGKDAGAIVGGRYARQARDAARNPGAFIVAEEERLARDDRPAQVAAELILVVRGLRRARPEREEIVRVERVVAEVLVGGPMEVVGPGFGRHADGGAGRTAVLRGIRARDDLELLNGVDRRPRYLRRQFLDVLGDAVVVHAVEQEIVLQRPGAVDIDAAGAAE